MPAVLPGRDTVPCHIHKVQLATGTWHARRHMPPRFSAVERAQPMPIPNMSQKCPLLAQIMPAQFSERHVWHTGEWDSAQKGREGRDFKRALFRA